MKRILILCSTLIALAFASCARDEERVELWTVASEMGIAHGVFNLQPALMIRTDESAAWRPMFDNIEGFTYEPGYEYRIRVRINPVAEPMADAPSSKYALVELYENAPPPRISRRNTIPNSRWRWAPAFRTSTGWTI